MDFSLLKRDQICFTEGPILSSGPILLLLNGIVIIMLWDQIHADRVTIMD